jgi:hypothetical protein
MAHDRRHLLWIQCDFGLIARAVKKGAGMKRVVAAALWLASPALAQVGGQAPIELTAPAEIREARALHAHIERISGKVTPCVEKGGDPKTCQCQDADELAALRRAYEAAVAGHPAWRGRTLFFSNADGSYAWNISMPGLERALSACP